MQVLAIGGGGDMARAALPVVCHYPEVERITVADIDLAAATTTATSLGAKARTLALDVLDAQALQQAINEADVVLNTCGPFFRYGLVVLRAVIAAGKPYFDICDDPEPTLGMLSHDREARANQCLAVIGLGASPGITNLLAVKAYHALDSVERLYTCWNVDGEIAKAERHEPHLRTSAAYVHWMRQLTGDISVYRHGQREITQPLSPITLHVPGAGKRRLYRCGHPEAVTLGRNFRELIEAPNLMVLGADLRIFLQFLANQVNAGKMDIDEAANHLARKNSSVMDLDSKFKILFSKLSNPPAMPELFALAQGTKAGKKTQALATLNAYPELSMAQLTGLPLALGLRLFIDGTITDSGVHAPETILDADAFFQALADYCRSPEPGHNKQNLVEITLQ